MNCKKIKKLKEDNPEFLAHLEECPSCRKEFELESKSWELLNRYQVPKLREDFTAALMEKVRQMEAVGAESSLRYHLQDKLESFRKAFAGFWRVPLLTLAACAVYVLCVEVGHLGLRHGASRFNEPGTQGSVTLSTIFSVDDDPHEGTLMSLMMRGVEK